MPDSNSTISEIILINFESVPTSTSNNEVTLWIYEASIFLIRVDQTHLYLWLSLCPRASKLWLLRHLCPHSSRTTTIKYSWSNRSVAMRTGFELPPSQQSHYHSGVLLNIYLYIHSSWLMGLDTVCSALLQLICHLPVSFSGATARTDSAEMHRCQSKR